MTTVFLPGDEVLIRAKVRKNGANYLVVTVQEIPNFKVSELIVFKESAVKFLTPTRDDMAVQFDRNQDNKKVYLSIEKFSSVAVVREINEYGEVTPNEWLQDLNDPRITQEEGSGDSNEN